MPWFIVSRPYRNVDKLTSGTAIGILVMMWITYKVTTPKANGIMFRSL